MALILTHLGFAYIELGRQTDAIAAFERGDRARPAGCAISRATSRRRSSTRSSTTRRWRSCAAVRAANPADPRLARLEADALRGLGRFDEGAASLKTLADAATDDMTPWQVLSEYYASDRRYADAAAVLKTALGKEPRRPRPPVPVRRDARAAEAVRRGREGLPAGARAEPAARAEPQLPRLHDGRAGQPPRRGRRPHQAGRRSRSRTTARTSTAWAGRT